MLEEFLQIIKKTLSFPPKEKLNSIWLFFNNNNLVMCLNLIKNVIFFILFFFFLRKKKSIAPKEHKEVNLSFVPIKYF